MLIDQILLQLVIATATGLVIGFERGWSGRAAGPGQRAAGIRTFGLAALAGGTCAVLPGGWVLLGILVAAIAVMVAAAYIAGARRDADLGLTTEIALLATPLLGALATLHPLDAIAIAALIAALLGFKQELHHTIERLGRDELLASVQLLIVAVVILPLLPDAQFGPRGSINPRTIGLLVLMLLGISYLGYFAVRMIGRRRGLLLMAVLGGLVSSTAVTLAYARLSRRSPESAGLLSAGITLACATMAPRVFVIVTVVQPQLAVPLALPLALLGLIPLGYALATVRHGAAEPDDGEMMIHNPLAIRTALALAAGVVVLMVALGTAQQWLGDTGVYVLAGLSGAFDVDAIAVAMAQGIGVTLRPAVATLAILCAVVANTLVKAGMAAVVGTAALGRRCAVVLALAGAAAGAGALLSLA